MNRSRYCTGERRLPSTNNYCWDESKSYGSASCDGCGLPEMRAS